MGKRRDSNPQGCGAEETRSVFQRSTQEAKRRSGTRPPTRRTRNPSVPALKNTALQALMNLERFLVGKRRNSNPQGCGAEETRSVFQRSTQGAERRSGSGRRQPHADIPLGAPQNLRSPLLIRWRAFCYPCAAVRTRQGANPGIIARPVGKK